MSYAISFTPKPPSAPSPLVELAAFRFRIPSVWRWLARKWEKGLLELKGFRQMVSEMAPEEASMEIGHWEKAYLFIEKYHDTLEGRIAEGTFSGQNILHFFNVVVATKTEIAALIASLQLASRKRQGQPRKSGMAESLSEIGMRSVLQLSVK
ncbi:MAG: hypothetical protein U0176_22120 [Bacteroidia bacterium]